MTRSRRRARLAAVAAALPWIACATPTRTAVSSVEGARVARAVEAAAHAGRFEGAGIAVVDGRVVWRDAVGADPLGPDPRPTTDHVFALASLTKLMTQTAVLRLAQQRRLDLDDPLGRWLPDAQPDLARGVTVRDLLSMRAGLPRELDADAAGVSLTADGRGRPFMESLRGVRAVREPGSAPAYSNVGYWYLGAVLEAVTGRPYADAVSGLVLEPAGMTHTFFGAPPSQIPFAPPRPSSAAGLPPAPTPTARYASGAYASTVDDLAAWLDAVASGGLLDRRSVDELAAAWGTPPWSSTVVAAGTQPGVATAMVFDPARADGVILLANRDAEPPDAVVALAVELFDLLGPR